MSEELRHRTQVLAQLEALSQKQREQAVTYLAREGTLKTEEDILDATAEEMARLDHLTEVDNYSTPSIQDALNYIRDHVENQKDSFSQRYLILTAAGLGLLGVIFGVSVIENHFKQEPIEYTQGTGISATKYYSKSIEDAKLGTCPSCTRMYIEKARESGANSDLRSAKEREITELVYDEVEKWLTRDTVAIENCEGSLDLARTLVKENEFYDIQKVREEEIARDIYDNLIQRARLDPHTINPSLFKDYDIARELVTTSGLNDLQKEKELALSREIFDQIESNPRIVNYNQEGFNFGRGLANDNNDSDLVAKYDRIKEQQK